MNVFWFGQKSYYQYFICFDIKLIAFSILVFGVFDFGILDFGVLAIGVTVSANMSNSQSKTFSIPRRRIKFIS